MTEDKEKKVKIPRQKMPSQPPEVRKHNFDEVALGYSLETAKLEASRCIQCKKPKCKPSCPVEVKIPEFILKLREEDMEGAFIELTEKNNLPAICGRVCPQETQCESGCVLGKKGEPVSIGRLERFVADWAIENLIPKREVKKTVKEGAPKVAIVGSGPAGLTAAADLARMGYEVHIFESLHKPGGVLAYGIPNFRLPNHIREIEIEQVQKLGVKIHLNSLIGQIFSIDDLFNEQNFKAIFLGTGAGLPSFMNIPGENLIGVYSANEFLTRVNLMQTRKFPEYATPSPLYKCKSVAVIGAGNVAMDAARCSLRMGMEKVYIVYRRSRAEAPARLEELEHAEEEGIIFNFLTAPVKILGDENNRVIGMECIKMELGEPDASGRRRPVPIKGSEFKFDVDVVIMAIGTSPNPILLNKIPGLEITKKGTVVISNEETGETTRKGIFAGGDVATGAATVIQAMGAGKKAARGIDKYIREELGIKF